MDVFFGQPCFFQMISNFFPQLNTVGKYQLYLYVSGPLGSEKQWL
jgi:hypothetical protein